MGFPHWGDVPTWVGAVGTLGAFWTGGWLLVREMRAGRERDDLQRRADEEARRRQASQVAVWPDRVQLEGARGRELVAVVQVANASGLPVYDATLLYVSAEGGSITPRPLQVVAPGQDTVQVPETLGDFHLGVAGGNGWVKHQPGVGSSETAGPDHEPYRFTVGITFRDGAGVWWTRRSDGTLVEGRDEQHPEPFAT